MPDAPDAAATPGAPLRLVLATRNAGKVRELDRLLAGVTVGGAPVVLMPVPDDAPEVDEDAPTLAGNAAKKARALHAHTGLAALADDSGLFVPSLGGAPGVRSARYAGDTATDADNRAALRAALDAFPDGAPERRAYFETVLAYVDAAGTLHTFGGRCDGVLVRDERGTGGFGYDALFVPDDGQTQDTPRTFAEMPPEAKNAVSHRARALAAFVAWLPASDRPMVRR